MARNTELPSIRFDGHSPIGTERDDAQRKAVLNAPCLGVGQRVWIVHEPADVFVTGFDDSAAGPYSSNQLFNTLEILHAIRQHARAYVDVVAQRRRGRAHKVQDGPRAWPGDGSDRSKVQPVILPQLGELACPPAEIRGFLEVEGVCCPALNVE